MEYNIDELRLKTASQLDDNEREYLKANTDKLNDEDKEAYADFLSVDVPATQEVVAEEVPPVEAEPTTPAQTEQPKFTFNTEAEAREFVKNLQREDDAAKQKAIDEAKTPEQKKYVEDNWKPADWNEAMRLAVKHAKEEIREEDAKKEAEATAKRLDEEWKQLSTEKKLPPLTTEEGRIIHANIIKYGVAAGKQTFHDAYNVWANVPKEHGGGLDPKSTPTTQTVTPSEAARILAEQKKTQLTDQKKVAAKIGGQNNGGKTTGHGQLETPDVKTLRSTPIHKLIKGALNGQ